MSVYFLLTERSKEKSYHQRKAEKLAALVAEYKANNKRVIGFTIVNEYNDEDRRASFIFQNIETGERREYLNLEKSPQHTAELQVCDYYGTKDHGLSWLNDELCAQVSLADVVVFGKVGLWELAKGGFYRSLNTCLASAAQCIVITRRVMFPKFIETFNLDAHSVVSEALI